MGLRGQVVNLVRRDQFDNTPQTGAVSKVAIVELQALMTAVEAAAQMVYTSGGEAGGAAHDSVNVVALGEQQVGQIRAVLSGHAGNQRSLTHSIESLRRGAKTHKRGDLPPPPQSKGPPPRLVP